MPAISLAQKRLMQAAEHGAQFGLAKKLRLSMTREQLHDYAASSAKGLPEHKRPKGKR